MFDKCFRNELSDIKVINAPDLTKDLSKSNIYIYAALLKPGYHQLHIYDPQSERAFCQDFVLKLNSVDLFPEFPLLVGMKTNKRVQNVWRKWLEDTQDDIVSSFDVER